MIQQMANVLLHYPYKIWGFGESIAMEALLLCGGTPAAFATNLIKQWATLHPPLALNPLSHVAPGVPLLMEYTRTQNPILLKRALELGELHAHLKRGRHGARIHRPDLAGWENEVWVDNMHLTGPFLARLGQITNNTTWFDLAAEMILSHAHVLQDQCGLFSHGFNDAIGEPNSIFWGRGQGWALLGLTDTLSNLPSNHPARPEINTRLHRLVAALAQSESLVSPGTWHTVVNQPDTYLESSVGAFVALGVGHAILHQFIDTKYQAMVNSASTRLPQLINPNGEMVGTSDATPVGADVAHYAQRRQGVFAWGQAAALLALMQQ